MGCVASKNAVTVTPASGGGIAGRESRPSNVCKHVLGEQVAAGWPAWLSAAAAEAIQGWVPLRADAFEKLEKIGQGTYSSVFRARDLHTGRIVALKKVKLENLEPDCIRFMSREIILLRRLDHPNIIKLDGLITSQFLCSIYLVFEYMEHDLAGLLSCPDITFSEPQVKCYVQQLLSGLDHCHSRGIMHRDIKSSNLLLNNEGVLKIADFGLANVFNFKHKRPLTSRVVTLWYRPPELLLGSIYYGPSVDLWSVGCVFAELLLGKPILRGQTEVEQLHKIFKLCGSPPEDYWRKSRLPNATIIRPQHSYKSSVRETCKGLPESAINLIEVLLSVEPHKRGTAASALKSEYFATKPFACDPLSLPKYHPIKEIDARRHAEHRQRITSRRRSSEATSRLSRAYRRPREANGLCKLTAHVEGSHLHHQRAEDGRLDLELRNNECNSRAHVELHPNPEINLRRDTMLMNGSSSGEISFSELPSSSGFAWARKQREKFLTRFSHSRINLKSVTGSKFDTEDKDNVCEHDIEVLSQGNAPCQTRKHTMQRRQSHLQHQDHFDSCKDLHSEDGFQAMSLKDGTPSSRSTLDWHESEEKVDFSGPLISQSHKVNELLQKHERRMHRAIQRRAWYQRVLTQGK